MAIIKITLNEDHLKLLSQMRVIEQEDRFVGYDKYDLYYSSFLLETIAIIIGREKEAIPNTDMDPDGKKFPKELTDYLIQLHEYICDNLSYIESIIHQFLFTGIKPGLYKCKDYELIWEYVEK
jgi:hypothetical protein